MFQQGATTLCCFFVAYPRPLILALFTFSIYFVIFAYNRVFCST